MVIFVEEFIKVLVTATGAMIDLTILGSCVLKVVTSSFALRASKEAHYHLCSMNEGQKVKKTD